MVSTPVKPDSIGIYLIGDYSNEIVPHQQIIDLLKALPFIPNIYTMLRRDNQYVIEKN